MTTTFVPFERAKQHPITLDKPAVNFFEGALLGNGGLGVVVTTRPDSVLLHFGHNNVWDIRVAENHQDKIGTFREIFEKVRSISPDLAALEDDPWYAEYLKLTEENYRAPYPRPFPCGSLLLGFDRRRAELIGHHLDIATGLCEVLFNVDDTPARLQIFVEMAADRVWMRMVDADGQPTSAPFDRMRLLPDPDTPEDLPSYSTLSGLSDNVLAFEQVLPFQEPDQYDPNHQHPKDRAFRLLSHVNGLTSEWQPTTSYGVPRPVDALERKLETDAVFMLCVQLEEGLASDLHGNPVNIPLLSATAFEDTARTNRAAWEQYWNASGVRLSDTFLERIWYWNLYLFNCAVKSEATCPGLFANWSYRRIGTAWHGDYHMNYNTQQPFWVAFSSNHVDKHLSYVNLVDHLLPISRKWAREYYELRGAYFPHSAYPVEMNIMPYPVPTWGWEICETPWTVQSLWWHYLYTMDTDFLRTRAFTPIREAVLFLVDYMMRPEAHGDQWGDDRYHIFPTVVPELYGITPGLNHNADCLVDLTLTRFVFRAYQQAVNILRLEEAEAELVAQVNDILAHFPEYPTAATDTGPVFVSISGENPEIVYNVPNSTMTVFPGEEHGLHSPTELYEIAANSYRRQRNEGGNELVFLNLQGARLGLLDLERFKRQVNYCLLPNGACNDMVLQVHGRYSDNTPYDFMRYMGIWFENLALPVVINECLLQSYNGTLRFFPNWPLDQEAEFFSLRAVGGFLVSAACAEDQVKWIQITSEAGSDLSILSPWPSGAKVIQDGDEVILTGEMLTISTRRNQVITLKPLS